jgi:hypothetical protein
MQYRANQQRLGRAGILPRPTRSITTLIKRSPSHGARQTLDVALVIDTTGSISDEIRCLQTEF